MIHRCNFVGVLLKLHPMGINYREYGKIAPLCPLASNIASLRMHRRFTQVFYTPEHYDLQSELFVHINVYFRVRLAMFSISYRWKPYLCVILISLLLNRQKYALCSDGTYR